MHAEKWQRIRELFRDALHLSAGERAAWLRKHCSDPDERREVESLLAIHHDASGFLEHSPLAWQPPDLGTRLAERYELLKEIGRGGMAVVFEAWDHRLERSVAVKISLPTLFTSQALRRFEREAQVVARLDHPSIVPIYDYGSVSTAGSVFLVMPLVDSRTLRDRLDRGRVESLQAVDLAAQLARALAYSHSRGVVHRDVKPENVLVLDRPRGPAARLMDFGLALDDAKTRLTHTGAIFGTPAYMSPEQLSGGEVDGRSDLYALGTVLYECLAAEPPFTGSMASLFYRIVHEPPRPLSDRGVDLTPELEAIVLACLAKDPAARPSSGEVLADALESQLDGGSPALEIAPSGRDRRPASRARNAITKPRRLWPALAVALTVTWLSFQASRPVRIDDIAPVYGSGDPAGDAVTPNRAGRWSTLSSLRDGRAFHAATLLHNGQVLVLGGAGDGDRRLMAAEIFDPALKSWRPVASMSRPRALATATVLLDGRILVAGGADGSVLNSAELFDPENNRWLRTASMAAPHRRHTATRLRDGRVLVIGGGPPSSSTIAEIWDPASGMWTRAADCHRPRRLHAATLLPDGRVLAIGGSTDEGPHGVLSSVEAYDPASDSWTPVSPMGTPRFLFTATLLRDGEVLVAGGVDDKNRPLRTAEVYDPRRDVWTSVADLNAPRYRHTASLLPDGRGLVTGGRRSIAEGLHTSAELYDPGTETWTRAADLTFGRERHTATLLPGGRVLVVGGNSSDGDRPHRAVELFDPAPSPPGRWSLAADVTLERRSHGATILLDGRVLVAGGISDRSTSDVRIYDPDSRRWTPADSMARARHGHSTTLLADGRVLVVGGRGVRDSRGVMEYPRSAELFDARIGSAGHWRSATRPHASRIGHSATLLADGRVLISGGVVGQARDSTPEIYDPSRDRWYSAPPLKPTRAEHTATLMADGRVLVVGGVSNGNVLASVEGFDPRAGPSGRWTSAPPLHQARAFHAASLLPDGRVLVTGGVRGEYLASAEIYDPHDGPAGAWRRIDDMTASRMRHTATVLLDGRVLVIGNAPGPGAARAEIFDPLLERWTPTSRNAARREQHSATLLAGGRVLVVGGIDRQPLASAEIYDPSPELREAWRPTLAAITSPLRPGAGLRISGDRFAGLSSASGGNDVQNSSSRHPLLQLRSLGNEQTHWIAPADAGWSSTSFSSRLPIGLPRAAYRVTVFTNGIPSRSRFVPLASNSP